ncbi:glycoside hydrolase family 15 protein [Mycena sp. CBHHK59/15]|nr:glycoside hydrolase family 15 protein [Mycena sp. CBHHK59/15]
MNVREVKSERDYIPISDHGLIGNLRTAALVSTDGSIESYCIPNFDSPSVFARILDKNKGGHFSITPTVPFSTKQNYLPSSNVLQTKFMNEQDFLPRQMVSAQATKKPLLPWLIRRVEVIRGTFPLKMECAPAFNYARSKHTTTIVPATSPPSTTRALFESDALSLDLRYVPESTMPNVLAPFIELVPLDLSKKGHLGLGVQATMELEEGQCVTFVLRTPPPANTAPSLEDPVLTKSTYTGSWKEAVHRSALALKLLIYEPTGAAVASPTFSLPEFIGGTRNWDYRASWIRDSSFTLYALIRLGFTKEADAYMEFIFDRLRDKNPDGSLQIMYTIHGGKDLEEIELTHLDGHKGSKPVRIGNGAADHLQLDIYGELEVRNKKRHFTYSKVMLWVAIDRGLRLADKRSLPCPHRNQWLAKRDELYEEIMRRAWNKDSQHFGQSYEETDVLDSAVLIMPLVFFIQPSDPRFVNTLKQILKTPERGGLTSNNLVFRYDVHKSDDGVGGEEGTFCLCTLWCVEALTRAGEYDRPMLHKAVSMFEDFLLYLNHVGLCTEEISDAGEGLGNAVQGFTHVTLISAAYNLSRTLEKPKY